MFLDIVMEGGVYPKTARRCRSRADAHLDLRISQEQRNADGGGRVWMSRHTH